MLGIRIFIVQGWVEGFETSGQDDGPHLEFHLFVHLGVVYGASGTEVGADFTITGKKVGTLGPIYCRYVGHCLSIGDINGLSSLQALVILRKYWPNLFVGDFRKLDVAGGADKVATAAGYTCFRECFEGGCHLHLRTAAGKVNCPSAYPFAHADAESTKDAIVVVQLEPGLLDPELGRQIFDEIIVRAASQEELNYNLSVVDDLIAICLDLHARPHRIVTRGYKSCSPSVEKLHRADPAQAGRFKGFVVTEGGYVDVVLLCNLKDCCPFFSLYFFAVELKGYHVSFLTMLVT
jgi:hypothetical protein